MMKKTPSKFKQLWIRIASIATLVFLVVFSSLWLYGQNVNEAAPFSLTDQNRGIYNSKEDDRYKLIFFGFTNCPEVCPTGLANMNVVMQELGPKALQIQPIFITVDPDRDTPEVIKNYIANFDARLIGLSGEPEKLEAVQKRYAVYAKKVTPPEHSDYTMNHSAHVYLTNKHDIVLEIFDYRLAADKMVSRIRPHLETLN